MTKFGYIDLMTEYDQIPMYMYLYPFTIGLFRKLMVHKYNLSYLTAIARSARVYVCACVRL